MGIRRRPSNVEYALYALLVGAGLVWSIVSTVRQIVGTAPTEITEQAK